MTEKETNELAIQLAQIGEKVAEILRKISGHIPETCIRHSTELEYYKSELTSIKNDIIDLKSEIKQFQKEREERSVWTNRSWIGASILIVGGIILAIIKFGLLGGMQCQY